MIFSIPGWYSMSNRALDHMDQIVQMFASEVRQKLGHHVRQIVLFGSRARGTPHNGSDYDMVVVVDHRTPELRAVILDIESELMDRYGVLVATILRSEEEWRRSQAFPLAQNIIREGVAL
jgi:predicted nucleotidyltransferase